jgi:pyridoxine kinase
VVNSVHFSNHTGYKEGFEGDVLKGDQLRAIMAGLKRNELLQDIGHVLTGYIGSESFLEAVLEVIKTVREQNGSKIRFVCDPVLGDKGQFYVPIELVRLYREKVIPLADVLTPNQFEVEQLTGIEIKTMEDAKRACHQLHEMGPSLVFITSMELGTDTMAILASERSAHTSTTTAWRIDCPILPGHFTGTGDLCAALLLAHTAREATNIPAVMEKVINTMFAVLERTLESAGDTVKSRELKLIQSKDIIEDPPQRFKAERIE